MTTAGAFVEAAVARKAAKLRIEAVVMEANAAAGESRVLELPMGMPFRSAIEKAGADHLLFVVHPRETDWALTGIRREPEGFALRADLPEAWAGLTAAAFEAACGVPGARFCHNARFIAVAANRQAALQLVTCHRSLPSPATRVRPEEGTDDEASRRTDYWELAGA